MKDFSSSIRLPVIIFCIMLTAQWLFVNRFYGANIRKVYIGSAPRDIDISKSDPNIMYVTSVGLYKSEDAGNSYRPINIANLDAGVYELEIYPSDPAILYGLANTYIMEQYIYAIES